MTGYLRSKSFLGGCGKWKRFDFKGQVVLVFFFLNLG